MDTTQMDDVSGATLPGTKPTATFITTEAEAVLVTVTEDSTAIKIGRKDAIVLDRWQAEAIRQFFRSL
jgi:hypothetical protein